MSTAFEWVGQFADWIAQFVPHWRIVDTRHGALKWRTVLLRDLVKFRWDSTAKVVALGPGFHIYWPLFTVFEHHPVKRQTVPLASQIITTSDEVTVVVTGMIAFDIVDLIKIQGETWDPDDTVRDIAASSLHDVCCHKTWEELRKGQGRTLDTALRNAAKKDLADYGVQVLKFTLTTMARTRVYRLVQSNSQEGEIR